MRLFYAPASPFVAKVRMAASHCGIELETVRVDTSAEPTDLTQANPLGKIPALVLDDGETIFDSRVICDLFDRMTGNQLLPQTVEEFGFVKTFEAACDGLTDALILTVYEGRYRPEEKRHQPWIDMQMRKADRALAWIETHVDRLPADLTTAHFALAAVLGWMGLRFEGKVEAEHPKLADWLKTFASTFPSFEDVRPQLG